MGRTSRTFERREPFRDSDLVVIATEGQVTEPEYFRFVSSRRGFGTSRIQVKILPAADGLSAPEHVLERLSAFAKEHQFTGGDIGFLVIDKDRWPDSQLSEVARGCSQSKFNLIVSNPCFELWLLIHAMDIPSLPADQQETMLCNEKQSNRRRHLDVLLGQCLGSYNKSNPCHSFFVDPSYVDSAISRAKHMDSSPTDRWPNQLGTRVYKIVELLIKKFKLHPAD